MELDWRAETVGGVTLVSLWLENERTVDRRVRIRNRLDGPVLPPRRQREPEPGWDREGLTVVVPARSTVACGYACPTPETESPVAVAEVGPPDRSVSGGERADDGESVEGVIRRLGDPRPPQAVVGGKGESQADAGDEEEQTATPEEELPGEPTGDGEGSEDETVTIELAPPDEEPTESDEAGSNRVTLDSDYSPSGSPQRTELPSSLVTALVPYRRRVETVEALGLASVTEATALLETTDGIGGVERAGHQLDADAAALRTLAVEATALAARAEAATAPLDALRRLS